MNIPKVSKEVGGILKFQRVHKSPPHPALFYQKMTLNTQTDRLTDKATRSILKVFLIGFRNTITV